MQPRTSTVSCFFNAFALAGAVMLTACDPGIDDPEAPLAQELDSDGESAESGDDGLLGQDDAFDSLAAKPDAAAAHPYWIYSWEQGDDPVFMGDFDDRYCFLIKVQGHFSSGDERLRVYENQGSWWLGGMGFHPDGIRGSATCISRDYYGWTLSVSQEYLWRDGSPPVDMGPSEGRVCMLTHVQGDLNGEQDGVEVYPTAGPGGRWWLGGSSSAASNAVSGAARCVDINPVWLQGPFPYVKDNLNLPWGAMPMASTEWYTCGLTKVFGIFDNPNERIEIYEHGLDGEQWRIDGADPVWDLAFGLVWGAGYCF